MVLDHLRRAVRRTRPTPPFTVEAQPDALPKTGLFAEPVRVASIRALDAEDADEGRVTVAFLVEIRDTEDQRCSTLAVEARVRGPEREWLVSGNTDLMGRLKIRATGPRGEYTIEVLDVAAGGLQFDTDAGPTTATTTA